VKQYLNDLKTALSESKRFTEAEINDILADHEEMISEALASGLAETEIETKFGNPQKVATDLIDSCGAKHAKDSKREDGAAVFTGVPPAGVINLTFRLASEDITITAEARDDIAVFAEGDAKVDLYEIGFVGNEFVIKMKKNQFRGWFQRGELSFDVRIPGRMEVGEVIFQKASGDYKIDGVKAAKLRINIASGDGEISDGSIEQIDIASVNGDLKMERLILGAVSINQVSGDLVIEHVVCEGDLEIGSTSGDVEIIDTTCANASFHTVSGDLEGSEFYPATIKLNSVSGDVNIENTDRTRTIQVKTTHSISGSIRISEK